MAWDFQIDTVYGDMTGGYVTGRDEIVQRITTRLWRHLGEWFMNTSAGLPWYKGPSTIIAGELSPNTAILGNRDINEARIWIRREIADTEGVIEVIDFSLTLTNNTRVLSVRAQILTNYGYAYVSLDRAVDR